MIDLKLLCSCLEELSDERIQQRLWLGVDNSGEMSSFSEAVCGAFDDARLSRAILSGRAVEKLAKVGLELAKELDRAIELIPDELSDAEILRHPNIVQVRNAADALLRHILNQCGPSSL